MAPLSIPSKKPLNIEYPSNHAWTIYGSYSNTILAQPKCIPYPLFIGIIIPGAHIGHGPIADSYTPKSPYGQMYEKILSLLTKWSDSIPNLEELYSGLPFLSSRIQLGNWSYSYTVICPYPEGKLHRTIIPRWEFENKTQTLVALRNLWGIGPGFSENSLGPSQASGRVMPPTIPLTSLVLKAWLHDTVNLVTICDANRAETSTLYAFKTNKRTYQLYQEMNSLLNLPPNKNIVQISFLVTKSTLYSLHNPLDPASPYLSEPTEPIIGFLTPFHSGGKLGNALESMKGAGTLTRKDQAKWARQLTSALLHIYQYENGSDKTRCGVYTNLKMDNIILTSLEAGSDLLLVDFEKGNNWPAYEAPEIESAHYGTQRRIYHNTNILLMPNSIHNYIGPVKIGYESPYWASELLDCDREAAVVWSLGCCLFCILKGCRCLTNHRYGAFAISYHAVHAPGLLWTKPGVPEEVQSIIAKCFCRDKKQRPGLKEILHVFEKWEEDLQKGVMGSSVVSIEEVGEKVEEVIGFSVAIIEEVEGKVEKDMGSSVISIEEVGGKVEKDLGSSVISIEEVGGKVEEEIVTVDENLMEGEGGVKGEWIEEEAKDCRTLDLPISHITSF